MKMNVILIIVGSILLVAGIVMSFVKPSEPEKVVPFRAPQSREVANSTRHMPQSYPQPEKLSENLHGEKNEEAEKETESKVAPRDEAKTKGNDFEGYVADVLAANGIKLKQWNQGSTSPGGAYAENELNPDFFVEQSAGTSPVSYWVECKYRSRIPADGFRLEDYQLKRYKGIQKDSKRKIVVALGVGGSPSAPSSFYIIPLDSLSRFKRIPDKYLEHYQVPNPSENFGKHMHHWFFHEVFNKNK